MTENITWVLSDTGLINSFSIYAEKMGLAPTDEGNCLLAIIE